MFNSGNAWRYIQGIFHNGVAISKKVYFQDIAKIICVEIDSEKSSTNQLCLYYIGRGGSTPHAEHAGMLGNILDFLFKTYPIVCFFIIQKFLFSTKK